MKVYAYSTLLLLIVYSCKQNTEAKRAVTRISVSCDPSSYEDSLVAKERIMLKNFAFCECLSKKYPNDSVLVKDGTAPAYFELSSYEQDAFIAVSDYVQKVTVEKYKSKTNANLYIMQCLDVYNSKGLDSLVRLFDREIIGKE